MRADEPCHAGDKTPHDGFSPPSVVSQTFPMRTGRPIAPLMVTMPGRETSAAMGPTPAVEGVLTRTGVLLNPALLL